MKRERPPQIPKRLNRAAFVWETKKVEAVEELNPLISFAATGIGSEVQSWKTSPQERNAERKTLKCGNK